MNLHAIFHLVIILVCFALSTGSKPWATRLQVCEWARPDGRSLQCPTGKVLSIVSAVYGRKSLTVCKHGYHRGVTNCGTESSLHKSRHLCNGKQKCYLRASNSMFGDPCWGINKYLDVSYTCVTDRRVVPNGRLRTDDFHSFV